VPACHPPLCGAGPCGPTGLCRRGAFLFSEPCRAVDENNDTTILLVNDNPDQLHLMQLMLKSVGYRILTADDGREGFDVLLRERVDILVSDVMMPGVDGIELCRLVRASAALKSLPILLVSALRKDTDSVIEGLRAGADAYLEHPFEPMALVARVARLVERKRSEDQVRRMNEELEVRVRERTAQLEKANEELEREAGERRSVESALATALDAALESARLKSEFLANVSHEIRTPMHAVTGMAELLLNTPLKPRQREFVESIMEGARSLLDIINDVLDLSKIEAGKFRVEKSTFNLPDTVDGAAQMFAEGARAKGLELSSTVDGNVPTLLQGDAGRLRQVIVNLLGNAVKFTEAGRVILSVALAAETASDVTLRFEVRDTGIGVSPGATRRIFLPFTQADGSNARAYGGTGLGLAISRQLVELMGGEIGVESEVGWGSTFWFTVKLGKLTADTLATAVSGLEGLGALVVAHDAASRDALLEQVRDWGMRAAAAVPESALRLLREAERDGQPFAFALIDLHAPDARTFGLARRVREEVGLGETRLILIASRVLALEEESWDERLFDACLVPPMKRHQLYDCLRAFAEGGGGRKAASFHDEGQPATAKRATILVAEDNRVNQRLVTYMLEELGYETLVVGDGESAVSEYERGTYGLVLMDCQMPVMDGYAAVAEIRRREGVGRRTPVVALTADAMKGTRERCLAAGMDDYLSKPFTTEQLGVVVKSWVDNASDRRRDAAAPPERDGAIGEEMTLDLRLLGKFAAAAGDEGGRAVQLVETFLSDMRARRQSIRKAYDLRDAERLRREAHALKGSAGLFGAMRLSKICSVILDSGGRGDRPAVSQALEELDAELAQVRLKLERWKLTA
jgi:two-component system, sensor histidine kinase and response regulator